MDVKHLLESDYVTIDLVKKSLSKTGVILSAGVEEKFKETSGLKVLVEFEGKQKNWKLNKTSLQAFVNVYGEESNAFVGKQVLFSVEMINNKESLVGRPVEQKEQGN